MRSARGPASLADLTQHAGRFNLKDLCESIVEPSKVVSDQYKASVVRTVDDKSYVVRIVNDAGGILEVDVDPDHLAAVACRTAGRNMTTTEWSTYMRGETYRRTCPDYPAAS